jgi:hypothetical protein
VPTPAHATFPGDNGKLAITSDVDCDGGLLNVVMLDPYANESEPTGGNYDAVGRGESPAWSPDGQRLAFEDRGTLYTVNADGSGSQPIGSGYAPAWSPDGQQIAYQRLSEAFADIHVMNADGSGDVALTAGAGADTVPSWSPDGTKIAFATDRDGNYEIYVMDAGGGNETRLTTNAAPDHSPNWSPDGSRIAFSREGQILVIRGDGSGETAVGSSEEGGRDPAWSPDGSKIAFASDGPLGIYAMNADGSDVTLVYPACGFGPDWQPVLRGHPRPRGASPFRVPLVLAYGLCGAPNRTHGAPLAFPSCAPAAPVSQQLTVGSPDANGQGAKSVGFLLMKVTLAPDVAVQVAVTDVRRRSDLSDYTGELVAEASLRLTDKASTPSPTAEDSPATLTDTRVTIPVSCAATADTTTGSTCTANTTANALYPGLVEAGGRAVWALGRVEVSDAGADETASTAGDNGVFLRQCVFVP